MSASTAAASNPAPPATTLGNMTASENHISNATPNDLIEKIQRRNATERDKRLRADGNSQFIDPNKTRKFSRYGEDPWLDPRVEGSTPILKNGSLCKYLIVGAGYGGLLFAVRMIQAGIPLEEICIVDSASGFGGTWYWNRYPGLMCDVEAYIYMPLLEETGYVPKHKYSYGTELRGYAEKIAAQWKLRDRTQFRTQANAMTWDDENNNWVLELERKAGGETFKIRSQFVVLASGLFYSLKLPGIPGIENFKGHSFHTSRWDYSYTGGSPAEPNLVNLKDKKVGIIGTGATAIQVIPQLAKWAKELYVFQRTPSSVDERGQRQTDATTWTSDIASKKGWTFERRKNFNAHLSNAHPEINMVDDGWTRLGTYYALIASPKPIAFTDVPSHVASLNATDVTRQEMIRSRIQSIVKDKDTAEKLKPWYPTWCKRPCFHDDYLPAFNLPHVKLVDTNGKGVEKVTPSGLEFNGVSYPLDVLIFSTGYYSLGSGPDERAGMTILGRKGKSIGDKWKDAVGTLHGVISRDFPNLFIPGPHQMGTAANVTHVLDIASTHVAYMLSEGKKRAEAKGSSQFVVEPSAEGEESWSTTIMMGAGAFAAVPGCTPSYFTNEGEIGRSAGSVAEQMKKARASPWPLGMEDYIRTIEEWRQEGGLKGLEITVVE